jgi:nucleotide-binding universal stress UspA family protein
MRQILLLTDFSENSFQAILYAMNFFENEEIKFHILHIKDSRGIMMDDLMTSTSGENMASALLGNSKKKLEDLLEKVNSLNNNSAHQFITEYIFDTFFDSITEYCKKEQIEILLMGTTGATGAKQVFLGSTAAKIINKIDIPILAIPEGSVFVPIEKVLFSVDYKVSYLPVTVHPLIKVLKNFMPSVYILYADENIKDLTEKQLLNKIELHKLLENFNVSTHKVTSMPLDQTLSCLLEFLQIDLLIMIKKEKTFFQKIINSSHIRKVSYHIKTPLFILPEQAILMD